MASGHFGILQSYYGAANHQGGRETSAFEPPRDYTKLIRNQQENNKETISSPQVIVANMQAFQNGFQGECHTRSTINARPMHSQAWHGSEPRSLASTHRVLTVTPQGHATSHSPDTQKDSPSVRGVRQNRRTCIRKPTRQ
jgi:hypothetical protein